MIDLSAREAHFLDHLEPIWRALPASLRGTLYVSAAIEDRARALGIGPVEVGWPVRGSKLGPILVASFSDMRICSRTRRKVILAEASELYAEAGIEVVSSFEEVIARAHVYAVDNSSTLFEFAALDRPVVVLNARAYRRDVAFGLRFWSEADVGLQAEPSELADVVLEAFTDPPEVAGSRRAAVARAYAVTDGTSSARAAEAIVSLLPTGRPRRCPICGAAHCSCGPPTTVVPIDQRTKEPSKMAGPLKKYPNPARKGAFLKLSDADAKRLGLFGTDIGSASKPAPVADVTNPGGDALVTSPGDGLTGPENAPEPPAAPDAPEPAPSASPLDSGLPRGAMAPAGPTHRARAATVPDVEPDDEDELDEEADDEKPAKKAASSSRRRRKPAES